MCNAVELRDGSCRKNPRVNAAALVLCKELGLWARFLAELEDLASEWVAIVGMHAFQQVRNLVQAVATVQGSEVTATNLGIQGRGQR